VTRFERVILPVSEQRRLLDPPTTVDLVIAPPRRREVEQPQELQVAPLEPFELAPVDEHDISLARHWGKLYPHVVEDGRGVVDTPLLVVGVQRVERMLEREIAVRFPDNSTTTTRRASRSLVLAGEDWLSSTMSPSQPSFCRTPMHVSSNGGITSSIHTTGSRMPRRTSRPTGTIVGPCAR
jgi:hypothetical protein